MDRYELHILTSKLTVINAKIRYAESRNINIDSLKNDKINILQKIKEFKND
jgi:hypothetical protein